MQLNAYAAQKRLALFEEIRNGQNPSEGTFDEAVLREGRTKGQPQVGSTRYEPYAIILEFIFHDPRGATVIFPVRLEVPERIVFLPVPNWVVENIWQGDIDGMYHFESEARRLLALFSEELEPEKNAVWFGPRAAKRRE
jgi:hypothetical protein